MMRKILGIFAIVFFLLNSSSLAHPFKAGEKLCYTIKIVGIPAGSQVLEVQKVTGSEQNPLYVLSSRIKSSGVISFLFQMEDKIKSYVDVETLYPRLVKINIQENSRVENMEVKIENEDSKIEATVWDKKRKRKWTEQLSSPPLDMLSVIYWIRAQELKIGKKFEVLLLDTPGSFKNVQFEISGTEKAYTYLGVFPAFICQQTGTKGKIKIWLSKDERHLPLYIQISTPLGFLTAILQDMKLK